MDELIRNVMTGEKRESEEKIVYGWKTCRWCGAIIGPQNDGYCHNCNRCQEV